MAKRSSPSVLDCASPLALSKAVEAHRTPGRWRARRWPTNLAERLDCVWLTAAFRCVFRLHPISARHVALNQKHRLCKQRSVGYLAAMSATEILNELPKLTEAERRAVRQRLRELSERDEQQFLHESADAMFQDLDKQEADHARRKAR